MVMAKNPVGLFLSASKEESILVKISWAIKEVRFLLEAAQKNETGVGVHPHAIQIASIRPLIEGLRRIRALVGVSPASKLSDFDFMDSFKLLSWNYRGAANDRFRNEFRRIFSINSPDIVTIMETKVGFVRMGNFFEQFGLTGLSISDPKGRAGGLWMLWNPELIKVKVIMIDNQVIHAVISRVGYEDRLLSTVYASPNQSMKEELWQSMESVASLTAASQDLPWMTVGDFNDITDSSECRGMEIDGSLATSRSSKFVDNINKCPLMDLGCVGPKLLLGLIAKMVLLVLTSG